MFICIIVDIVEHLKIGGEMKQRFMDYWFKSHIVRSMDGGYEVVTRFEGLLALLFLTGLGCFVYWVCG